MKHTISEKTLVINNMWIFLIVNKNLSKFQKIIILHQNHFFKLKYLIDNKMPNLKRYFDNSESENFSLLVLSLWKQSKGQRTAPILGISKASKDPWFSWKNRVKDRQFLWAVIWFVNFVENGESTYQYQFSNSFENRADISLSLSLSLRGTGFWFPLNSGCES